MENMKLKKLTRAELLEMLIAQSKEVAALKEQLNRAEEQLRNRQIIVENAGSVAEASLQLNGVFEAAQNAADQYLENIRRRADICEETERKSRERAEKLLNDVRIRCNAMVSETQKKCEDALKIAQLKAQICRDGASEKAERPAETQTGLKNPSGGFGGKAR